MFLDLASGCAVEHRCRKRGRRAAGCPRGATSVVERIEFRCANIPVKRFDETAPSARLPALRAWRQSCCQCREQPNRGEPRESGPRSSVTARPAGSVHIDRGAIAMGHVLDREQSWRPRPCCRGGQPSCRPAAAALHRHETLTIFSTPAGSSSPRQLAFFASNAASNCDCGSRSGCRGASSCRATSSSAMRSGRTSRNARLTRGTPCRVWCAWRPSGRRWRSCPIRRRSGAQTCRFDDAQLVRRGPSCSRRSSFVNDQ